MVLTASQDAFAEAYENTGIGPLGGQSARVIQVAVSASEGNAATFTKPVTPGSYLLVFARDYNNNGNTMRYTGDAGVVQMDSLLNPGIFGPMVWGDFVSNTGVRTVTLFSSGGGSAIGEVVALEIVGVSRSIAPTASSSSVSAATGQLVIGATDANPSTPPTGWLPLGQIYDSFHAIGLTVGSVRAPAAGTYNYGSTVLIPSAELDVTSGASTSLFENSGLGPLGTNAGTGPTSLHVDTFLSQPAGTVLSGHTLSDGSATWINTASAGDWQYMGDGTIGNLVQSSSFPSSTVGFNSGSADGQASFVIGPHTDTLYMLFRAGTVAGAPYGGYFAVRIFAASPTGECAVDVYRNTLGSNFTQTGTTFTVNVGQRLRAIYQGTKVDLYVDEVLTSTYTLDGATGPGTQIAIAAHSDSGAPIRNYISSYQWSTSVAPPTATDVARTTTYNTNILAPLNSASPDGFAATYTTVPANDMFAQAKVMNYIDSDFVDTTDFTIEAGEFRPGGSANHTAWYSYTPGPGLATVDTSGTFFTATVAVYTGSAMGGLALVDWDTYSLQFATDGHTTYWVQIGGYFGGSGPMTVHFNGPVPPTPIAAAATLQRARRVIATGRTLNCLTATSTLVRTRTSSDTARIIAVRPASSTLTRTRATSAHGTAVLWLQAVAHLSRTWTTAAAGALHSTPPNDLLSHAATLTGLSGSINFGLIAATVDQDDDDFQVDASNAPGTVWFFWTPNLDGIATLSTVSGVALEAFIDTGGILAAAEQSITFVTRDSESYYIRAYAVDGNLAADGLSLSWSTAISPIAMSLSAGSVPVTPTSLGASVVGETPGETLTFTFAGDSTVLATAVVDDDGTALVNLPIPALANGTYTVEVTNDGRTGTAAFDVASTTVTSAPVTSVPPPPAIDPAPVSRWQMQDPTTGVTWVFPVNPTSAESTILPRNITAKTTTAITGGQTLLFEGGRTAKGWQFKGHVLTLTDRETLEAWVAKPYRLYLTDDFGRTFIVKLLQAQMTPVRDAQNPGHHTYVVAALLYGRAT